MDPNRKKRLERKFDRKLTGGEAAEIENTPVLHRDDEAFYEGGGTEAGADGPDGEEEGADDKAAGLFHMGNRAIRYPT